MTALYSIRISTTIILHHSKEEDADARPGLAAVLLCSLPVVLLTGFDSSEFRLSGRGRGGLFLDTAESEMSIFGSPSAQTRLDWHVAVHTQTVVLLQCPGDLFPVELGFGGVLRAKGRPGVVLTGEAGALSLTGDLKGQEVTPCH